VCGGKVTTEKIILKIYAYYKFYFKMSMSSEMGRVAQSV
jgi:hypothetical protein